MKREEKRNQHQERELKSKKLNRQQQTYWTFNTSTI